eukprot:5898035-Prymnesium_polylepis.1
MATHRARLDTMRVQLSPAIAAERLRSGPTCSHTWQGRRVIGSSCDTPIHAKCMPKCCAEAAPRVSIRPRAPSAARLVAEGADNLEHLRHEGEVRVGRREGRHDLAAVGSDAEAVEARHDEALPASARGAVGCEGREGGGRVVLLRGAREGSNDAYCGCEGPLWGARAVGLARLRLWRDLGRRDEAEDADHREAAVVDLGEERLLLALGRHLLGEAERVPQVERHLHTARTRAERCGASALRSAAAAAPAGLGEARIVLSAVGGG